MSIQDIINQIKIRDILQDGYKKTLIKLKNDEQKYLFDIFCGIGKSRFMTKIALNFLDNNNTISYVFPTINLINQFNQDYIDKYNLRDIVNNLSICSRKEIRKGYNYTTTQKDINTFLNKNGNKIILVTYKSFETLNKCLKKLNKIIDICCFDEAHRSIESDCCHYIYDEIYYKKGLFFTATPAKNNNYCMYDYDNLLSEDCGERLIHKSYFHGLNSGILNSFNIRTDIQLKKDDNNTTILESIFRAVLTTQNNRVLSYHKFANSTDTDNDSFISDDFEDETEDEVKEDYYSNVEDFVFNATENYREIFNKLIEKEFPDKKNKYKKIIIKGLTAKSKNKINILKQFDETDDDIIYILASCKTISEGIDTKNANMVVFVDTKKSYVNIIQNIGRCIRKNEKTKRPSTVLIPTLINYHDDYNLEDEINKTKDYSCILNVVAALLQNDEEIRQLILQIKNTKNNERKQTLKNKLEKKIKHERDNIKINSFISDEININWNVDVDEVTEQIKSITLNCFVEKNKDRFVNWHDNLNKVQEYININNKRPSITSKDKNIAKLGRWLSTQLTNYNKDIKLCKDIMKDKNIKLEFENFLIKNKKYFKSNEELWHEILNKIQNYLNEHHERPSAICKDKNIEKLGKWLSKQLTNYNEDIKLCKDIMKNKNIKLEFEKFLIKNKKYIKSNTEKWYDNLNKVQEYININNKKPSESCKDKNIKKLRKWLSNQLTNYNKDIMKDKKIKLEFEKFLIKNKKYFKSYEEKWYDNLNKVQEYININNKKPSIKSKDKNIKKLGQWLSQQLTNYNEDIKLCKYIMKDKKIKLEFENFLIKNKKYFKSNTEKWYDNLNKIKEYININNERPSSKSKNSNIAKLGEWLSKQLKNNNKDIKLCKQIMKDKNIKLEFEKFLIKNKKYFNNSKKKLEIIKNLENEQKYITVKYRPEQKYLRKYLIENRNHECFICNEESKDLCCLETAHLKPHCDCNEDEKIDIEIVQFMCLFCHKYYDNGLIGVNENKIIISNKMKNENYKNKLENKEKIIENEKTKEYLDYHFNNIFCE